MKITKITEFKDNKELTSKKHSISYEPKFIYIPLSDNFELYDLQVKLEEKVKVGQVIAISNKYKVPYHSSISGVVTSINKKMWTNNGKMVNCVEIQNDYQNQSVIINENNSLDKENILKLIQEKGIIGMGGAGFPTYIKYQNNNIETLIINGCECEPFITCDYRIITEQAIKLINGIHYLIQAFNIKTAIIAIKEDKKELVDILNQYIDNKINIFLVPNKYPVGFERYLVYKIIHKRYLKIPSEVGCVVNNVSTIIAVYDAIKYNKPLIERMVTITGYCLDKQININLKIGTSIEEVLDEVCHIKHKYHKKHFTAGGLMTGKSIISDNLIVTKTLNSVVINPFLRKQNQILECIGCGKCSNICPMKLTPTEIKKYYIFKDKNELINLKADWCVQCGLCSYICPSRIDLTQFTSKAKYYIKRG